MVVCRLGGCVTMVPFLKGAGAAQFELPPLIYGELSDGQAADCNE